MCYFNLMSVCHSFFFPPFFCILRYSYHSMFAICYFYLKSVYHRFLMTQIFASIASLCNIRYFNSVSLVSFSTSIASYFVTSNYNVCTIRFLYFNCVHPLELGSRPNHCRTHPLFSLGLFQLSQSTFTATHMGPCKRTFG